MKNVLGIAFAIFSACRAPDHAAPDASAVMIVMDAAAPKPAPVVRVTYNRSDNTGGVSVACTGDEHIRITYFNRGFSKHGAEVVPIDQTIPKTDAEALLRDAQAVADAIPAGFFVKATPRDGGPGATISIEAQRENGDRVQFQWPAEGMSNDPRVDSLATRLAAIPR